ncbi:uncharacterized protein LOC119113919 [Pollicipes pollicipes]|uniref:uncharacterized protein LOC119113919 n=1 Tax=Pollicipes pollicipes TaxID=41117 RepID=UPI001885671A|nr:uncharacterized protein LOC119113919 [Pollicipes pollicipes]
MQLDELPLCTNGDLLQTVADSERTQLRGKSRVQLEAMCGCLPRCSVDTVMIERHTLKRNRNNVIQAVEFAFDEEVEVVTNSLTYDIPAMLSEVGGNAGLYLGYSLLTLLDAAVDLLEWSIRKLPASAAK